MEERIDEQIRMETPNLAKSNIGKLATPFPPASPGPEVRAVS